MKLQLLVIFLVFSSFQQNETVKLSEIENVINAVIRSNDDLSSEMYIVYNRLFENTSPVFLEYGYKFTDEINIADSIIHNCSLQLINDKELEKFKLMADSINRRKTKDEYLLNKENKFTVIKEKTDKWYCEFSIPIFTTDKKYSIVKFNVKSGYMWGDLSMTYLMEKLDGKWIKKEILEFSED
ncbi:hypothetical protein ACE1ET_13670 [Saccharicrinis sp. FJH62]|uniref:hypothetical protein n=1 Tax=Saccharicrinis sp. FJH62 TaxID=3344657 RepID=UPI0035D3FCB3